MPDTTTDAAPSETDDPAAEDQTPDLLAERDKWKALSRKNEQAAREAQAKLRELEQSMMTDTERRIAEARDEARREAQATVMQRVVAAEIKAALTGVVPDPALIVDDLNLGRYLTGDGEIDSDAIGALREKFTSFVTTPARPSGSADLGARPATSSVPLNGDPIERALRNKLGIG